MPAGPALSPSRRSLLTRGARWLARGLLLLALVGAPAAQAAPGGRNVYGIQTLVPTDTTSQTAKHLTWAKLLAGPGGHVTQPFSPIDRATEGATDEAVDYVRQAYALGLDPILVLEGDFANGTACDPNRLEGWVKPTPDMSDSPAPSYLAEAAGFARFVAGLPREDGHTLYVEVWNEPNLNYMWGGAANPVEYARFFVDVSRAIRSLGDGRIKILNAALAPEGDVDNLRFVEAAIAADPAFLSSFDSWATHPYPRNQPPENNLHDGTALPGSRYTIDAYLLELDVLKRHGFDTSKLQVALTETGYKLDDDWYPAYPIVDEENRAAYIHQAFERYWSKWPEILTITPFELSDSQGSWREFDWIWSSSGVDDHGFPMQPHLQYARMLNGVGVVTGVVTDDAGKPLRGATVATEAGGHRATSGSDGSFVLIAYPGTYELSATRSGYGDSATARVTVSANQSVDATFALTATLAKTPKNPSVETGDLSDWTPFGEADGVQQDEWFAGITPYDGHYFLGTASNCSEKDGGYFQTVGATPGSPLQVSAQVLTYKVGSEPMGSRVGVDPLGGTDPAAASIVWSPWTRTGGAWKRVKVSATPQADRITIFLQYDQNAENEWNINAFDRIEVTSADGPGQSPGAAAGP